MRVIFIDGLIAKNDCVSDIGLPDTFLPRHYRFIGIADTFSSKLTILDHFIYLALKCIVFKV